MDAYGCLDYAREVAHGLAGAALHEYGSSYGSGRACRDARFVQGLIPWVLERR